MYTLLSCLLAFQVATAAGQQYNARPPHVVDGKLWLPVFTDQNIKSSKIKVLLSVNGGAQLQSFLKADGAFSFHGVPAGTHMIDVVSLELVFPQVRIDVDGSTGRVAGSYANNPLQGLPSPLTIRPVAKAEYYEKRPPFNLQSMIMSPYGLMIGFMIFALFIMPMLKVDPNEYKEFMGDKAQPKEAISGSEGDDGGSSQQRLQ